MDRLTQFSLQGSRTLPHDFWCRWPFPLHHETNREDNTKERKLARNKATLAMDSGNMMFHESVNIIFITFISKGI